MKDMLRVVKLEDEIKILRMAITVFNNVVSEAVELLEDGDIDYAIKILKRVE